MVDDAESADSATDVDAVDDIDAVDPPADPESGTGTSGPSGVWRGAVLTLSLVTVVALVFLVVGLLSGDDGDDDVQRGQDAVSVARQVGTGLIDVVPADIDSNVSKLRELTTGEFRKQFEGSPAPFATGLREQGIKSVGRILQTGIGDLDDETARVVMIGQARISSATGPQDRVYQFIASLQWVSGGWAVSAMEVR